MIIISFRNGANYTRDKSMPDVSLKVEEGLTNSENIDRLPALFGGKEKFISISLGLQRAGQSI